ncbi:helicase C-terminal domain-containing protein [Acidihalobacter ferrooxydans]|uniref:Helicase ATP-binding domain-containing protein n=1 Tax=Acidihalobacter ferrooxydans TaxID=1765967 RepID=A0A1P8UFM0_9GAMM|nr:helicase C-terminal domain-containing protein [Acidihalobacter ferrooxydans]APZ42642.1 hypothetical protein BW247_05630 [Acidihalobacter ferrooxydans]
MDAQVNIKSLVENAFRNILPELTGYSLRNQQLEYALCITDLLLTGRGKNTDTDWTRRTGVGLIEAGTGTGKTLGYLIPVAIFAQLYDKRVGISTHTLALQDQMWGDAARRAQRVPDWSHPEDRRSDIAVMREVVRRMGLGDVYAAFIRARRAYVSVPRGFEVIKAIRKENPDMLKNPDWVAFSKWLAAVEADIPGVSGLIKDAYAIPEGVSADDIWIDNKNIAGHLNQCYLRAKNASKDARVLLHTHAMGLIDARHWHKVLDGEKPIDITVFDEADQIEGMAESMTTRRMRPRTLKLKLAAALKNGPWTAEAKDAANQAISACDKSIALLDDLVKKRFGDDSVTKPEDRILGFDSGDIEQPTREALLSALGHIATKVSALAGHTSDFSDDAEDWSHAYETFDQGATRETICAIAYTPIRSWGSYQIRDMYPARIIGRHWAASKGVTKQGKVMESHHDTVLFTSATLTSANGDFSTTRIAFGLNQACRVLCEKIIEPQCDRIENRRDGYGVVNHIYCPVSLNAKTLKYQPWPDVFLKPEDTDDDPEDKPQAVLNPAWLSLAVSALCLIEQSAQEQTAAALVLTGSYKETEALRAMVEKTGIRLNALWHTERGYEALAERIDELRRAPAGRLLITPAAWHGISLRAADGTQIIKDVVLTRSPYPPIDPVRIHGHKLRQDRLLAMNVMNPERAKDISQLASYEHVRNGYIGFSKARQGIGRLIRDPDDVGNIWILDPRANPLSQYERTQFLKDDPVLGKASKKNGCAI